jgi:hypothetical protein
MTTYTAPDGTPVDLRDSWLMHRGKTSQAICHGVADAIDGVQRDQRADTVYGPAYWRHYRAGRRAYTEASARNAREDRVPRRARSIR